MIATIGRIGSSSFQYKRFALRGKALAVAVVAWRAEWLKRHGESIETRTAVREGEVFSEAAARACRNLNGTRVFGTPAEDDARAALTAEMSADGERRFAARDAALSAEHGND